MRINLYVSKADEPLFQDFRAKLAKHHTSMSRYLLDAARDYVRWDLELIDLESLNEELKHISRFSQKTKDAIFAAQRPSNCIWDKKEGKIICLNS